MQQLHCATIRTPLHVFGTYTASIARNYCSALDNSLTTDKFQSFLVFVRPVIKTLALVIATNIVRLMS